MKKTIFLSAALAFASFGAFAQTAAGNPKVNTEERAKRQTDKINEAVQLTPDQYKKVLEISKTYADQREALRASAQGEDFKAKVKELGQKERAELKKVLTPAQFEKLQAQKKEDHANRKAAQ